ncbi:bifunctional heparan sulfate N-deacetylase/N-sulfotransferase-like [Limulus polyphemus]|uniref:[heparan sulfate]-glucosamine N-sulfotransferase n=1 Tax=Limulus polyphemus TaxID=6850 RepID=A0ABM1BRV7_LIMPO|nr:bifunctional heparan sulfate N-deacetylase/N-sulfotransferase-like [Limulus polyphemus]
MVVERPAINHDTIRLFCSASQPAIKLCLVAALLFSVMSMVILSYYTSSSYWHGFVREPPQPSFQCHSIKEGFTKTKVGINNIHTSSEKLRFDPKVLVFLETQYSRLGKHICEILEASRTKYKVEISGKSLPPLTNHDKGKYAVIVFENYEKYLAMNKWNRHLLDKYCKEYNAGIIGFLHSKEETFIGAQLSGFPLFISTNHQLQDYYLNPSSSVLRLTRAGEVYYGALPSGDWTVFKTNDSSYEPVTWSRPQQFAPVNSDDLIPFLTTVIQDHGRFDGIQRVLFGNGFEFWLHKLLFLDSVSWLSHGKLSLPLYRYLQVDIDDIFVGEKGTRMKPVDVQALLHTQEQINNLVPGFRFNLGFSGKFYHRGTEEENEGDDILLAHHSKFWWFCHMWSHTKPHLYDNISVLEMEMTMNLQFAQTHGIKTDSGYSVAPHHSGIYPVHEILYQAWKHIWNIRVTATEEYPHLRPARYRRGFIHRNIMVLPRQTCGLYTHNLFMDRYPGGADRLDKSIEGGDLFHQFVYNPINVFMTHLSNYGNDRLALYTFESVIKFIQCWTNLHLSTLPPIQLAEKYFQMFPEESNPVWVNPCLDKRHLAIWSSKKACNQLPKFLVIGPQKTGTTALYTFLSMHPVIVSNHPSGETFEEVQFFNGNNYFKGLDWYMNFFPIPTNSSSSYMFEKSATYFDGELVPVRAHALLPHAKIVTILISPIKRAYSWYQHMKAHEDHAAVKYAFYEVVTASDNAPKILRDLKSRCLNPGLYAQHLERWLAFYPPSQLMIIDGEELKGDPAIVLNRLQQFLKIPSFIDFTNKLRYVPQKGFYCQVTQQNSTKCLGHTKGRHYPPVDPLAQKFLKAFYLSSNIALSKLLTRLRLPIPQWLEDDLS